MKLKKLLPIVALSGIATIATPLVVSCSPKQDRSVEFTIADSETTGEKTATLALDWNPSEDAIVFSNPSAASETMGGKVNAEFAEESRPQNINLTFLSTLSQDLDDVVVEFDYEDKTQKIVSHAKLENVHINKYVPEVTEWNAEVEPILGTYDAEHSTALPCDLPKAIHSTQITKNINDYELSFVNTATGSASEYVNQEDSYMSINADDDKYVDLHVVGVGESFDKMITINVIKKSDSSVVLSQPAMLWNKGTVEMWNPNVARTVNFDPDDGSFSTTSGAIKVSDEEKGLQSDFWWAGLSDVESGTKFVQSVSPIPFTYITTEDGYQYYDFEGHADELINRHEPITLTLLCNGGVTYDPEMKIFNGHIYNIEFIPM